MYCVQYSNMIRYNSSLFWRGSSSSLMIGHILVENFKGLNQIEIDFARHLGCLTSSYPQLEQLVDICIVHLFITLSIHVSSIVQIKKNHLLSYTYIKSKGKLKNLQFLTTSNQKISEIWIKLKINEWSVQIQKKALQRNDNQRKWRGKLKKLIGDEWKPKMMLNTETQNSKKINVKKVKNKTNGI